eukprot:sb/3478703/
MVRSTFYKVPKHISRSNLKFQTQLPTTDPTTHLHFRCYPELTQFYPKHPDIDDVTLEFDQQNLVMWGGDLYGGAMPHLTVRMRSDGVAPPDRWGLGVTQ